MAGPLAESGVFPSMVVQMIGVGEQTGAMDQMLQKVADFYEEEVDAAVSGLTSMIEPISLSSAPKPSANLELLDKGIQHAIAIERLKASGHVQHRPQGVNLYRRHRAE